MVKSVMILALRSDIFVELVVADANGDCTCACVCCGCCSDCNQGVAIVVVSMTTTTTMLLKYWGNAVIVLFVFSTCIVAIDALYCS